MLSIPETEQILPNLGCSNGSNHIVWLSFLLMNELCNFFQRNRCTTRRFLFSTKSKLEYVFCWLGRSDVLADIKKKSVQCKAYQEQACFILLNYLLTKTVHVLCGVENGYTAEY